ncbi:hypothetical protein JQC91_15490 [Jannaschia sp. Os4]|uniref:shikimate kinase n=1 Tax=Jannaschia sp. Os4 TaxID=2807617 RepID=UPI001939FD80|nr:shikimate kinase [Jannaschia sp. Os4]MBM2577710.1 hypothetical protein [Jannaschia sp. Os4]
MTDAALLSHVRWIGGGSGAGKTTVARRLAERFGARLYDTDAAMADHARRCPTDRCPRLAAFRRADMDARWLGSTPEEMAATFHWFVGEGFDLIVEDLRAMPRDRPIVAEGFRLLPDRVAPLLGAGGREVWLLPTPAARRRAFDARGTTWDIPARTSDPVRALRGLLARDALFTDRIAAETAALRLPRLRVGRGTTLPALERRAAALLFGPLR